MSFQWTNASLRIDIQIVISESPGRLVVDTGPVIGAMHQADEHHEVAARGIQELVDGGTQILIPVPIVFEVYKRLAYDVSPAIARRGLTYMRQSMTLVYFDAEDLQALNDMMELRPWWGASLEDAAVAMVALTRKAPAWTFNHRDFVGFPDLQFWTPSY